MTHPYPFTVTAWDARSTDTGVPRGADVDVEITIGGNTYVGEVTLVHRDGRWQAYGPNLAHWVDSALLRAVIDGTVALRDPGNPGGVAPWGEVKSLRRAIWGEVEARAAQACAGLRVRA